MSTLRLTGAIATELVAIGLFLANIAVWAIIIGA